MSFSNNKFGQKYNEENKSNKQEMSQKKKTNPIYLCHQFYLFIYFFYQIMWKSIKLIVRKGGKEEKLELGKNTFYSLNYSFICIFNHNI